MQEKYVSNIHTYNAIQILNILYPLVFMNKIKLFEYFCDQLYISV